MVRLDTMGFVVGLPEQSGHVASQSVSQRAGAQIS